VVILHRKHKTYCFSCGAEVFWSDVVRSKKTDKQIPVNEDEYPHMCNAYQMLKYMRNNVIEKLK
jgi:hypothetical protein